ncbi:MAG: hypothetical protein FJ272_18660 [Planctomycetes bacterium]|nr:hypothetical protein [Planctomycetota bacterium]
MAEALQGTAARTLVAETLSDVEPLPIYVQTRVLDDGVAVFWVNTSNRAGRVRFRCGGSLAVEDWDLLTGATSAIPVQVEGDETVWSEDVAPGQSRLLRLRLAGSGSPVCVSGPSRQKGESVSLADEWDFELLTPNVLVLDLVEYRVGDEAWSERKGVLEALGELRRRFGMANEPELRHNRAARFYDLWQNPRAFQTVQLRYAVHCAAKAADLGDVCFVVESGERFAIRVNGQTATDRDGAWLDPSFTKYRIGHLLRSGDNEIVLSTEFREDTELETAFVIGRFGVWRRGPAEFQLGSLPKTLRAGSWTEQGLPFFGGRVRIWQQVRLPQGLLGWELCASSLPIPVATVYAAGQKAGHLLWPPHRVPLPKALAGDVRLELECVSGMKNTLGPWHWSSAFNEARITAPNSWFNRCGGWADEYHLEPEGIPTGLRLEQTA